MFTVTVNNPGECPFRRATSCTYKNNGYARFKIICGPHMPEFPVNCPPKIISEINNKGLNEEAVNLLKVRYGKVS